MRNKLNRFFKSERGVTSIEYGILAAALALVITTVLGEEGSFNQALNSAFEKVAESVNEQTSGGSEGS